MRLNLGIVDITPRLAYKSFMHYGQVQTYYSIRLDLTFEDGSTYYFMASDDYWTGA